MTEFLIGGRGTGKSQEAIKWVRGSGNRYLVVPDAAQSANLLAMDRANASRRGGSLLHPEKFISYSSSPRRFYGQTVELGVDNLDMLLQTIFGRPVGFVTATGSLFAVPEAQPTNIIDLGGSS